MGIFHCCICGHKYDFINGESDERMCKDCFDNPDSHHFFLKYKGGDPRNHMWREVSREKYDIADRDAFFKRIRI